MIRLERTEIPFTCWEAAIRGMRNPMNSWDKSDTDYCNKKRHYLNDVFTEFISTPDIGDADLGLMLRLARAGSTHAKYRRMITVYVDITAPLYWWKEFDTYKIGTVANSCSTMHKIQAKPFTRDDFSHDRMTDEAIAVLDGVIAFLESERLAYLETKNMKHWHNIIQLLGTSYMQRRTVFLNYEVLTSIYRDRLNHKLDEWHSVCDWIRSLPYSEIIAWKGGSENGKS